MAKPEGYFHFSFLTHRGHALSEASSNAMGLLDLVVI